MTTKSPMIGVNLTSPLQLSKIKKMINSGQADFVEILIDNFLLCSPESLLEALPNVPLAFHIMRSAFFERKEQSLRSAANKLRPYITICKPLYVSDHVARFTVNNLPTPILYELDYRKIDEATARVNQWQDILGCKILLENFPSMISSPTSQADFFSTISKKTGCGILFDLSNAIVSEKNTGFPINAWKSVIEHTVNFHAGGFSKLKNSNLWVDSHDCPLAKETYDLLSSTTKNKENFDSICIEFDHNIDYEKWQNDLATIRSIF